MQFTVAELLTHLTVTLEVMGLCPSLGDISEIYFLESIQSLTQRTYNGFCGIAEFTVTCNVSNDNWYNIMVFTVTCNVSNDNWYNIMVFTVTCNVSNDNWYNIMVLSRLATIINTGQSRHKQTYTCTQTSFWLVLGGVTNKEYHLRLRFER